MDDSPADQPVPTASTPTEARLPAPEAVVALIPAYNPDSVLLEVLDGLRANGCAAIVVVDDGSDPACAPVFTAVEKRPGCRLLRHTGNRGKGRALKTGLAAIRASFPAARAIVTVDADGQHRPADVARVAADFLASPDALVIGARRFTGKVPLRSRLGNALTRTVFRWVSGARLLDTQSGLRCFPSTVVPRLLELEGERYEYEMNMLAACRWLPLPIREVPIETVYLEGNKSSHFNPFLDSMRIYFLLLRFTLSSLLASAVDFLVFAVAWWLGRNILAAMVMARLVSANLQFAINRGPVFRSRARTGVALLRYYALVVLLGAVSYGSIQALAAAGVNVLAGKVIIETLLFIASFAVQRSVVFGIPSRERT
jgi:glycosyltransferase involved in cell wall biosynthesis